MLLGKYEVRKCDISGCGKTATNHTYGQLLCDNHLVGAKERLLAAYKIHGSIALSIDLRNISGNKL